MASIAPQAQALPARVGTRYTVLERLGRGGMAVVYRVRDDSRDQEVALKQLLPVEDPERRRKISALFEREFHALAQLSHPSIVQAYDFGLDPAGPFYTMELLEGGDLNVRSHLDYRTCCELGVQVCSALSLIHSRRFIHRDLSPRNIHRTPAGRAKLIDFGALMPMGPTRQLVGTPGFASPEAVHGLALDARSDLFSLGATLYFVLTGRRAFVARTFEDLRDAWLAAPISPSHVVPEIPPELDALVLALLRPDPAHRPRSAFEVMQRLAAIGGISVSEEAEISQAYLSTPTLVGRDAELQWFGTAARRVVQGGGGALWAEGPAGSGRSRLLDAWVLEARTFGLAVARSVGGSGARPFTVAHELAMQLTEALPDSSIESAKRDGVFDTLFDTSGQRPRLKTLASLADIRDTLSATFATFIEGVSRDRAIMLAVDDADRADEASLPLLAALASRRAGLRLIVAVTVSAGAADTQPALEVLANQCSLVSLRPLTREQTQALFSSVFGPVPNVAIVSDRISTVAVGNPGASMAVAQHMVDQGLIRFAGGHWHLPAELTLTDLPANAKQVLQVRVANLPPLARRLAEVQALAIAGEFGRADYAELAGAESAGQIDAALDVLVQRGVLTSVGDTYMLAQGDRALLLDEIPAERALQHHRVLAPYFAVNGPALAEVHHWLMAGEGERALDRMTALLTLAGDRGDVDLYFEMKGNDTSATLEEAYRAGRTLNRRPRELYDLARLLVTLSIMTDNKLHARYGKYAFEQLALDSGLTDYQRLDPSLPASERLKLAFETAVARYAATPEHERVYRPDEAIRFLARLVSVQIAIGARTRNAELLYTNSLILEPFAPLTPLLAALSDNAIAAYEMNILGCVERARERVSRVYEQLADVKGTEEHYAALIRSAVATALAFIETALGLPSAERWIEIIESDRLQVVNALYMRRIMCIVEGDAEQAELYRTRAEVVALQSSVRQMFMPPLRHELAAHIRCGDLAGVKQVADQIARLAEDAPGWLPQHYVAQGYYQRMRGDLAAAQTAFERAIESCQAGRTEASTDYLSWASAIAGLVGTLVGRGQAAAACAQGREALARFEGRGMRAATWDLVRELAIAEAKVGEHRAASERLDALIERRASALPAQRVVDYEARVRVAIAAKDHDAAARYLALVTQHGRSDAGYVGQPRHVQLADEARRAGIPVELPGTQVESTVLGDVLPKRREVAAIRVANALAQTADASSRAKNGLALLVAAAGGGVMGGQLYLAHESGLYLAASQGVAADTALEEVARRYWQQLTEADEAASIQTQTQDASVPGTTVWVATDGTKYQPLVLRTGASDSQRLVGVALLAATDQQLLASDVQELASVLSTRFVELGDAAGVAFD
jgi:Protein kinase domain/AAA ATPase domain